MLLSLHCSIESAGESQDDTRSAFERLSSVVYLSCTTGPFGDEHLWPVRQEE
jgi:hypothetical protein